MKKNWPLQAIYLGILLLILGIQMFAVDSYRLTPTATKFVSRWIGPSSNSPTDKIQHFVVNNTDARGTLDMPDWVSWATFCAGGVLIFHGTTQIRKR